MVHPVQSSAVSPIHFSLRNIDQNNSSFKNSTQFQLSKLFPDNSIDIEGKHLMSNLDNKSLKKLLLNPQLHINVLIPKLLNKKFILPVHQLITATLLITLSIPHMN